MSYKIATVVRVSLYTNVLSLSPSLLLVIEEVISLHLMHHLEVFCLGENIRPSSRDHWVFGVKLP
jgi:hypothetical protein